MNYSELYNYLFSIRDLKFMKFSKTISNSTYEVIGVKTPILKDLVKKHFNDNELILKDFILGKYLEIDYLYYAINLKRLNDIKQQLSFISEEIKNAKSWAITDMIITYIKKYDFNIYYDFFKKSYKSKHLYERRMAYILGLKLYKDKNILKILNHIKLNEEYMVMMSEAWLLQVIGLEYPNDVYDYLSDIDDITLKRKTISKICDSRRVSLEIKDKFKKLRNNIE